MERQLMLLDEIDAGVRATLTEVLGLGQRGASLAATTELLGALPELDSMAVATVLTALEERFGIVIDDGDLSAETFETYGKLVEFVDSKLNPRDYALTPDDDDA